VPNLAAQRVSFIHLLFFEVT